MKRDAPLLNQERKERILAELEAGGIVRLANLADTLSVTERTIRRDLKQLEEEGLVERLRGGARLLTAKGKQVDVPMGLRSAENIEKKQRIANEAVGLIQPGQCIILDAGSTALAIAQRLPENKKLTIVTNAINIVQVLSGKEGLEVIVAGGVFRPSTLSMVGPEAIRLFAMIHADLAFLGTSGVNAQLEFSNSNVFEAEVKQHMIRATRRPYVVADHSKFGQNSFSRFATADDLFGLITDTAVPARMREVFRASSLDVHIV